MNLNSQDQILMSAADPNTTQVRGYNSAALRNGIAEFENLIVIAKPGSEGIEISATSNAVKQNRIQQIFGTTISTNRIETKTRYCKPGELLEGTICRECSPGTFSLNWNSPSCEECIEDSV